MDILKREIAPITDRAWQEIDRQATRALRSVLVARKIVDLDGPHGWEHAALALGRIKNVTRDEASNLEYGLRAVLPLVESRVFFEMDLWDLDNLERGALDIDAAPLDQAAQRAALFEERAVFQGLPDAGITGVLQSEGHGAVPIALTPGEVVGGVARGIEILLGSAIEGPYALVLAPSAWQTLAEPVAGFPAVDHVKSLIKGPLLISPLIEVGLLVSLRGGDFRLVVGQDFSIGYHSHTHENVRLFLTESFTFRVLEAAAAIRFVAQ